MYNGYYIYKYVLKDSMYSMVKQIKKLDVEGRDDV